jgi:hypothetical protein
MIFILFNAFGDNFDPVSFVNEFSIKEARLFKKGAPMSFGDKTHKQSGISISLDDSASSDSAIKKIEVFIAANWAWLASLAEQPVKSMFSIGVTVGASEAFAPNLEFGVDLLTQIASLKLGLNICCYPTSDELDMQT